jgi:hypothetical protein
MNHSFAAVIFSRYNNQLAHSQMTKGVAMPEARGRSVLRLDLGLVGARDTVALSFKVPFAFRRSFKLYALQRNLTMTEFLVAAVEAYTAAETPPERIGPPGCGNP